MTSLLPKYSSYLHCLGAFLATNYYLGGGVVFAQIVPDQTLPSHTVIAPHGQTSRIIGGTTAGNNLFHSFSQFSLPTGDTAFFDNAVNIENIIGRVTGSSISEIDGLIRANGTANLFLINPNGIIFGENASLDIGGSFIGSTAESIKFADGGEFSAIATSTEPLLTISIPVGLQYGNNSGDIIVRGSGHHAFFDYDTFTVDRFEREPGLEVKPDNTIALGGKNIFLEGGNLTASGGNIELGAVTETGTVEISQDESGWTFDYGELDGGKIELSETASVDVSGEGSGNVRIQGNLVNIFDGSAIFAETEASRSGGLILITAREVNITGTDPDLLLPSSIWSDVYLGATGDGGDVVIETGKLTLEKGGQVNVNTFSLGDGGDLIVRAEDIQVVGESEGGDFFSVLAAQADIFETGRGGDIDLETDTLLVKDGAQIITNTFGDGDAGDLTIKANRIELSGTSKWFPDFFSALLAGSDFGATGSGGNLTIKTDTLLVKDEAQIAATTFETGNAGNLTIEANQIELTNASGLFASTNGTGNGGNLNVTTKSLTLTDSGQINISTIGTGNAGSLNINAENINLSGGSELGASGILASALESTGNGGDINIRADNLSIREGATISTSNFFSRDQGEPGKGRAGNINIEANSLAIKQGTPEFPSNITASANSQSGGNINLEIDRELTLNDNGEITAKARGEGLGGNINLTTDSLTIKNLAKIAVDGTGSGNAGNINIIANDLNTDRGRITANALKSGGGDITITTDFIDLENNSSISTSVSNGTGGGGNIAIASNYLIGRDKSGIRANAFTGDGGNIEITTDVLLFSLDSEIDASSKFGLAGTVRINNPETDEQISLGQLPEQIVDPTTLVTAMCAVDTGDALVTAGKGGLAENPSQSLRGESVWEDLRNLGTANQESIVEAKALRINAQGELELLSYVPAEFNQCRH